MHRRAAFAIVLGGDLLAITSLVAWYLSSYQPHGGSFTGMMGQMTGYGANGSFALSMPWEVWWAMVGLIVLGVAGVAGLGYYLAYPQIRTGSVAPEVETEKPTRARPAESWEVLLRTSKPEERKVLEVLAAHDGSYLQKFVVKETGLSRLKTHRIVSRLAERGIVTVERSGNTNQVSLADWVGGRGAEGAAG